MENRQIIISIGREFGSGGRVIAVELAKRFNLPMYDRDILREIASERDLDHETLEKYDELPKKKLFTRRVRGLHNSPEEHIANLQFEFLMRKAEEGLSFVVVGRCSERVLREFDGLITIFVLGDKEVKLKRIMEINKLSEEDAKSLIAKKDRHRKAYHNYYSQHKWGDSRNYELSINSSKLGIDETINVIEDYINRRLADN